jgi:two-component system, OmpR family, sensor histidine kinase KdpD
MTRVVNNILDMTRLEAGPVQLDLQWYPLEEILGAALGLLKDQLAKRTVDLDIPGDLPMLHVDGVLFEKVLINLLENAAKYTPPGTHIRVSAMYSEGGIRISVQDDGPGIYVVRRASIRLMPINGTRVLGFAASALFFFVSPSAILRASSKPRRACALQAP